MAWLTDWGVWQWLILGFILLIGELLLPGIFLLWFGVAGIIMAALTALFSLSTALSWVLFACIAIIFSLAWWRIQHRKDQADDHHNDLNQRGVAMLGQTGRVLAFADNGIGRGQFGDTTWRIQGNDLRIGDNITVTAVHGITLTVEKHP
ncbi:NfeD family protein [Pasteurellaceae bacterium HPA106]|uniref:NfeD family protein n=1 Tax=Spirabiliibacterium pneumoniae TaxID=221400 RepID=UPI001AAC6CCF|nr:NfeD family protein [Spirabiliibacterium pneumoniae]MBE2895422.1 NfeD family protein [Spirabiliibacterium pneumoniae]